MESCFALRGLTTLQEARWRSLRLAARTGHGRGGVGGRTGTGVGLDRQDRADNVQPDGPAVRGATLESGVNNFFLTQLLFL